MKKHSLILMVLAGALLSPAGTASVGGAEDASALEAALKELAAADWGKMPASLAVIDKAVVTCYRDDAARKSLAGKLAALLSTDASPAAKQYACRKLSLIASAESVPALAPLLLDEKLSHMARVVLERIPDPAAARALRDALPKAAAPLKVGILNSLAVRGDREAIPLLTPLLKEADMQVAGAAAQALGKIGATEALPALAEFRKRAPKELGVVIADAHLDIAERLRAEGKRREAVAIYRELMADENKLIRLAVLRSALGRLRQSDDERKLRMLGRILERARDVESRKMVLRVLGQMGVPEAMKVAASALDDPGTAPDAVAALLRIAGNLHRSSPDRAVAALERVLARLEREELRKQVESQLQAWKEK